MKHPTAANVRFRTAILRAGLVALLLLPACATPYQPEGFLGGYRDALIDSNTASVSFTGNADTPRQTVELYLLYRCAEVARNSGYDYFVIINRYTSQDINLVPGAYRGSTYWSVTRSGRYFTGEAVTTGTFFPGFVATQYGAYALIKMFKGEKPAEEPFAFDAKDVIEHLRPEIAKAS